MNVSVAWGANTTRCAEFGALRVMELRFPADGTLPAHAHDRPTVAIVAGGALKATLAGRDEICSRSTLRTEPAGARHANEFGPRGASVIVVQPDPAATALAPVLKVLTRTAHFRDPFAGTLAASVAREFQRHDAVAALALEGLGLEIISVAARLHAPPSERDARWLAQATELIEDCFRSALRLGVIADTVGVRPARLARAFRQRHGVSVATYVRRRRLEWVAQRLTDSDEGIGALALQAGFADQAHLTRSFRAALAMTPGRYRQDSRG